MPRWPRMVVPGVAVHVIQRGNNRQPIFFATDDYARFRADLVIYSLLGFASSPQQPDRVSYLRATLQAFALLSGQRVHGRLG